MDLLSLFLVIASAFSHAVWNILAKRSDDKDAFMWIMTATSLITLLPVFFFLLPEWRFPIEALPYMFISAIAETLYFYSLSRAYELGDLSIVYPLARSSPLFLTILAVILLGEDISFWGIIGILSIVLGVYFIHLKSTSDLTLPLKSLKYRASQFALATAFWTTIYSLSDKVGVTIIDPIIYAFWLEFFIVSMMSLFIFWKKSRLSIKQEWIRSGKKATLAGFLMRFGYILVLVAMNRTQVSYILALRQISVVLGAIAGVLLLNESYGMVRILSSVIIFLGVYILAFLA
jgi:drug/metabolite transporter (DMT)-like permease